jgi:hypothetical protein
MDRAALRWQLPVGLDGFTVSPIGRPIDRGPACFQSCDA